MNGPRMYFFTLYNISPIQAGIACSHAALEYVQKFALHANEDDDHRKIIIDFIENHKTFVVLNGGTSITMLDRIQELDDLGIHWASFVEPHLNNSCSAIAFIVDESEYNPSKTEVIYETNFIYEYLQNFNLASN